MTSFYWSLSWLALSLSLSLFVLSVCSVRSVCWSAYLPVCLSGDSLNYKALAETDPPLTTALALGCVQRLESFTPQHLSNSA